MWTAASSITSSEAFQEASELAASTRTLLSIRKKRNIPSAYEHAEVVEAYLQEECRLGRVLGPYPLTQLPGVVFSRFGVIPKPHKPGKWRLILDLSHPDGRSVNDGIDAHLCSMSYVSMDRITSILLSLGPGALIAKADVASAYRIVPIHPDDRHLLGMKWKGQGFIDAVLPFGLRSAPKIFTALADALELIVRKHGVKFVEHYIDDFILAGPADSHECELALQTLCRLCQDLGVPLAPEKLEGPHAVLKVLGLELDTVKMEIRLPEEKLLRIAHLVDNWRGKKAVCRRELQSLVGPVTPPRSLGSATGARIHTSFARASQKGRADHSSQSRMQGRLAMVASLHRKMERGFDDALHQRSNPGLRVLERCLWFVGVRGGVAEPLAAGAMGSRYCLGSSIHCGQGVFPCTGCWAGMGPLVEGLRRTLQFGQRGSGGGD